MKVPPQRHYRYTDRLHFHRSALISCDNASSPLGSLDMLHCPPAEFRLRLRIIEISSFTVTVARKRSFRLFVSSLHAAIPYLSYHNPEV